MTIQVTQDEIKAVCQTALMAHGASAANAGPVAAAIAKAEAEGNRICGLFYLPLFCRHLSIGKVDGQAAPKVQRRGASVTVDAASGFAHPAIAAGMHELIAAARDQGVAAMAVRHSYNALTLGHHVVPLAEAGLIGICLSNAPASVAPPGAERALYGTNPVAFATPRGAGQPPILFDQSLSVVTKTEILQRRARGEDIPLGWAQDRTGAPTADPAEALDHGALLPIGGRKGANIALLVEILAAALTGSNLSTKASGFGNDAGGPPHVGQFLLAISPQNFAPDEASPAGFSALLTELAAAHEAAGVRLPGKVKPNGPAEIEAEVWDAAQRLCQKPDA